VVDVAPARERWITPHALLGATSAGSAGLTTAGLLAGPAGVATVSAAGVLVAGGVAAVRKFAPGAANKLGLKKSDKAGAAKRDRKGAGKGGLGRLGLLGGAGRKKTGLGSSRSGGRRGSGLLGAARRIAGKGGALAKRGTTAPRRKGSGLLAGKTRGAGAATGKGRGSGGLLGGRKPAGAGARGGSTRPPGGSRSNGSRPGGGKTSPGTKNPAAQGGAGGRKRGLTGRLLGGAGRLVGRGVRSLFTGSDESTPPEDKAPKLPKGSKDPAAKAGRGLLGGDNDRDKEPKGGKTKPAKKRNPGGRDTRDAITSGKPGRDRSRRGHGGTAMPDPFAGRREAISGAAPLEINRANDVIDYVTHAPDYAEAQARRWLNEADTIVDKVDLTPEFAESLKGYANAQLQQVIKVREFGEVFRRSHSDRLGKLERKDPREAMWDVDRNRD
jgi:hypothetical protein